MIAAMSNFMLRRWSIAFGSAALLALVELLATAYPAG
jgi:hypothetical protein